MVYRKKKSDPDFYEAPPRGELAPSHQDTDYEPLDTLAEERLASTDGMQVSYQAPTLPSNQAAAWVVSYFLPVVVMSVPLALAGRYLGQYFATSLSLTLFVIGTGVLCMYLAWIREATLVTLSLALSPIFLSLFTGLLGKPYVVLAMASFFFLFFAGLLSRLIAYQFVGYLAADMLVSHETRQRWQDVAKRNTLAKLFSWEVALLAAVLTIIAVVISGTYQRHPPAYGEAATVFGLWIPLVLLLVAGAAFFVALANGGKFQPFLFAKACSHWLTYVPHPYAPAVQRPQGIWKLADTRCFVTVLLVGMVTITLIPTACYFPVFVSRSDRWMEVSSLPDKLWAAVPEPQHWDMVHFPGYDAELMPYALPEDAKTYFDNAKRIMEMQKLSLMRYDVLDYRLDHRRWSLAKRKAEISRRLAEALSLAKPPTSAESAAATSLGTLPSWGDPAAGTQDRKRPIVPIPGVVERAEKQEAKRKVNVPTEARRAMYDLDWSTPVTFAGAGQEGRCIQTARFVPEPTPESWLWLAMAGVATDDRVFFVWSLAASFAAVVFVPLGMLFLCGTIVSAPLLTAATRDLVPGEAPADSSDAEEDVPETVWESCVQAILRSQNPVERESIYLGTHEWGDYPVMIPREVLREHAHIMGDTGSGKTALALAPMVSQLIGLSARDRREAEDAHEKGGDEISPQSSIVVIDLKGDPALFEGARRDAERAGIPFKWFANDFGKATHVFNPFTQTHMKPLSYDQRSQVLIEALGLNYGGEYGPAYYAGQNYQVISRAFNAFKESIQSFAQLFYVCQHGNRTATGEKFRLTPQHYKDAAHLLATVESLAKMPALNITATAPEHEEFIAAAANQIDMADVVRNPQVVYFYLTSGIEPKTVKDVAKLALFSLLTAAVQKPDAEVDDHQTYVFIDEFQQIVNTNVEIVLRQARSAGVAAILANQTISDLKQHGMDLTATVQANTRMKQFFASSDLQQRKQLVEGSGETIHYLAPDLEVDGIEKPYFGMPRLTPNDVIRMTDDETLSVVHFTRSKGFAQFKGFPFFLRSSFHISPTEYRRRRKTPWPTVSPGTMVPTLQQVDAISSIRPSVVAEFASEQEKLEPETVASMHTDEMFRRLHGQKLSDKPIPDLPQSADAIDMQERLNKAANQGQHDMQERLNKSARQSEQDES